MSETCKTIRVMPWSQDQGAFVEINESDFDENVHKIYQGKTPDAPPPAAKTGETPPPVDGLKWASNAARDKAIESGLDFSKVKGTGAHGKITAADVTAAIEAAAKASEFEGVDFASEEAGELASELGVTKEEVLSIEGTGVNGAVTVEDLEKFVDSKGE